MTFTQEKKVGATTSNIVCNHFNNNTNYSTEKPDSIDLKHWQEWQSSNVKAHIIAKNVCSLHDALDVDKLLNRNNKSRWKHSVNLVPAWYVSGIDPRTDERILLGAQVKPDTPQLDKQGRVQKYLSAGNYDLAPLFLDTGINGYWKEIIDDKAQAIFITEGAKKAGAGLSIGLATISIPGVSTCRKNGRLHELLNLFTGFGRTFYLCFDNDVIIKKPVQTALLALAKELAATGSKIMIIILPEGEAKGMDDYIAAHGEEAFHRLVESAATVEEWKKKLDEILIQQQLDEQDDEEKCKLKRQFELIRDGWGDGLRFNQLKNDIELGGLPIELEQVRLRLALEFNEAVPLNDAQAIVELLARKNSYSPVVEYLDSLETQYPDIDLSILDDIATRYFGSTEPLHNIYMKKTLLAAIARARQPGCKVDTATILIGGQGWGKSTFWKILFSEEWFCDKLGEAQEKDELMKLHKFWGLEWSEFETVYKRKDVSTLKSFMTSSVDSYRAPYARTVKEHPRSSILVGTTNETEILNDPTGSRRFLVIPVEKRIDLNLLISERDRIWAAANALYKANVGRKHLWDLSEEEQERQEILNREFQVKDPWEDAVRLFVSDKDYVTTAQVLSNLGVEIARQDIALARRASSVLKRMGWKYAYKRINSELLRVWIFEKNKSLGNLQGSQGSPLQNSKVDQTRITPHTDAHPVTASENTTDTKSLSRTTEAEDKDQEAYSPPPPQTKNQGFGANAQNSKSSDPCDPSNFPKLFIFSENTSPQCGEQQKQQPQKQPNKAEVKTAPAQYCRLTNKQMPPGFSCEVANITVKFEPVNFKKGGKNLKWALLINEKRFEYTTLYPQSQEEITRELEQVAAQFIKRYFG